MSKKHKRERIEGQFVAVPFGVIHSTDYRNLGCSARSLLIDIAVQFKGSNNGELVACWKYLKPLGWNSNATVTSALTELKASGLLVLTRQGARPNKASWFALGWHNLDWNQQMDIPRTSFNRWKPAQPLVRILTNG
jgi:hypothetical protein